MMSSVPARLGGFVLGGLLLTGLVLSCSGSPPRAKAPGTQTSAGVTSSPTISPTCAASQLRLALHGGGAASGNIAQIFVLANRSGSACTLDGYPSVKLLNAVGDTVFSITAHAGYLFPRTNPRPVTLAAHGGTASFTIGMVDDTMYCLQGSRVQVTLPGSKAVLSSNATVVYCEADRADEDPYDSPILSGDRGTLP